LLPFEITTNHFQELSQVEKFKIRQKDIVLSPIAFTFLVLVARLASQPLILSPIIFSEFFGLNIKYLCAAV
jgi:hypothetical protein